LGTRMGFGTRIGVVWSAREVARVPRADADTLC